MATIKCIPGKKGPSRKQIIGHVRKHMSSRAAQDANRSANKTELAQWLEEHGLLEKGAPWSSRDRRNDWATRTESKAEQSSERKEEEAVDRIMGPITISEYVGLGKHIYLLGDAPVMETRCPKLQKAVGVIEWLNLILQHNPTKTIDVFMEVDFLAPKKKRAVFETERYTNYLSMLSNYFYDCLKRVKTCSYDNLRAHYSDIRSLSPLSADVVQALSSLAGLIETEQKEWLRQRTGAISIATKSPLSQRLEQLVRLLEKHALEKRKVPNRRLPLTAEELAQDIHIPPSVYERIERQFANVESPDPSTISTEKLIETIRSVLGNPYKKTIERLFLAGPPRLRRLIESLEPSRRILTYLDPSIIVESAQRIVAQVSAAKSGHLSHARVQVEDLRNLIWIVAIVAEFRSLMDLYIGARMFRHFKRKGKEGLTPQYIVIYANNDHIQMYKRLFKALKIPLIASAESREKESNFQCVDVRSFARPFFSTARSSASEEQKEEKKSGPHQE